MKSNYEDLYRDVQYVLDNFKRSLTHKLVGKLESDSRFDLLKSFERNFFEITGRPYFKSTGDNLIIVTKDKSKALELVKKGIEEVKNYFEFPEKSGMDDLGIRFLDLDLKGLITYGTPRIKIEDNELTRAFFQLYPEKIPKEFNLLEDLNQEEVSIVFLRNVSLAEPHVTSYFHQELKRQYHNGGYQNVLIVFCEDVDKYEFDHKLDFCHKMYMKSDAF